MSGSKQEKERDVGEGGAKGEGVRSQSAILGARKRGECGSRAGSKARSQRNEAKSRMVQRGAERGGKAKQGAEQSSQQKPMERKYTRGQAHDVANRKEQPEMTRSD